jgi:cytoskeleton protein RodZ
LDFTPVTEPARHKAPYFAADAQGSIVARELKEAREALGITIPEMAQTLRIRAVHIEALEGGRFDELPGRPYTLGFARSIARHLGLDSEDVALRLRDEVMGTAPAVELVFPESTEDKRLSLAGWIAISLVLAAGAYGAWLAVAHRDVPSEFATVGPVPQTIPEATLPEQTGVSSADVPADAAAVSTEPAPNSSDAETDAAASDVASPAVAAKPPPAVVPNAEPVATTSAPAAKPASAAPAAPATRAGASAVASTIPSATAPAPSATAQQPAEEDEEEDVTPEPSAIASTLPAARVILHAHQDSWVQIQGRDGATVIARTLRAGESYTVPDQTGLKLTTGNAGGLDVIVDGAPISPLGQPGAVRRDIALDPARLKAGTALQ